MVWRRIGGIVAGLIAAWIPVAGMEMLNRYLYPPPPGLDLHNMTAIKTYVASLPPPAFAVVLIGWLIGTLLGTFVAARIARTPVTGYIVGVVLLAAGIYNAFAIPQPMWFSATSWAIFLLATIAGVRLAQRGSRVAQAF